MSLVAAKCTQCGASIEVDDSKEAGICRTCGTAFITEKAINNYNTYLTQNVTKNIYGREKTEAEEYLFNGEKFIALKDWEKAIKVFMQAAEANPSNYRCWFGLMRSETKNFTDLSNDTLTEHLEKALAVANENEKEIINTACEEYLKLKINYDKRMNELQKELDSALKGATALFALLIFLGAFGVCSLLMGVLMLVADFILSISFLIPGVILTVGFVICLVIEIKKDKKIKEIHIKMQALNDEILNTEKNKNS